MNWHRRTLGVLLAVSVLSACTGATAAIPSPGGSASPGQGSGSGGSGGSVGSDIPVGSQPKDSGPKDGHPVFPAQPELLVPHPGHVNLHPVAVTNLEVVPGKGGAVIRASWWSGIEPCTGLDSVLVRREEKTILITVREGSPPNAGNVACIDIAMFKATLVDLRNLPSGSYAVSTTDGDAEPVKVIIP
jgi:hypothetical protein